MSFSKQDEKFMRRCLALARKGEGRVSPNPLVGAVLAKKGKILGEGAHERFGWRHAEPQAIYGKDAKGSTLYVSLEPCSHLCHGKHNPPCAPIIAGSGIKRVVVACKDPNPCVNGKGISFLKRSGLTVEIGLLENEAKQQNEAFFKLMKTGKPFVVAKLAQSADGFIGIRGKSKVWLSGREFDRYCHQLRNRYDAILVGIGTVLADNPILTCRIKGGKNPARIILDSKLRIPLDANVLKNAKSEKVVVATTSGHDSSKKKKLESLGVQVLVLGKRKVSLSRLISYLPKIGIYSLLIEGGAQIVQSAIKEKCVDKLILAVSKKRIGCSQAIPSPISPEFVKKLAKAKEEKMGEDKVYFGYFRLPWKMRYSK